MRDFGDLLRSCIKESGYTIYGIAKKAEVNRTTLQKVLSNDRPPSFEMIDKLLPLLKLSPCEKDEIMSIFEIQKTGEALYYQRNCIKQMLEQISADVSPFMFSSQTADKRAAYNLSIQESDTMLYQGSYPVTHLLTVLLEQECKKKAPVMMINAPANISLFNRVIMHGLHYFNTFNGLHIQHLTGFLKAEHTPFPLYNLRVLSNILPLIAASEFTYDTYYYYNSSIVEDSTRAAFPYYIVLTDTVILLSADCDTALPLFNSTVVYYFRNLFEAAQKRTTPLSKKYLTPQDLLPYLLQADMSDQPLYSLEYQPCFATYLNKKIICRYARPETPNFQTALTGILNRSDQLRRMTLHTCVFSKSGLIDFARNGRLSDFPPEYMDALKVEDRIYLLNELYQEIDTNRQCHRVVNPLTFPISRKLICALHGSCCLDFNKINTSGSGIYYIHITEQTLLEAFEDFFKYLTASPLVYSKKDTLKAIGECIQELQVSL